MRFLHTSDWHIGKTLYGQRRYDEFAAFLDWLVQIVERERIDALLVPGDIFDTTTPSNRSMSLYYSFLSRISSSSCRHVVITAGNHDSPTFLDAPKELLRSMAIHVVGSVPPTISDEVIILNDLQGEPEAIICAVPYLRDRDLRQVETGESAEDKDAKLIRGIQEHYRMVAEAAAEARTRTGEVPVVAMGHLFTAGGRSVTGDGVRELYVGSLAHVGRDLFSEIFDYTALGHLHVPQRVGGEETIRYSGSPIPMGFGEAGTVKEVLIIAFDGHTPQVDRLEVPVFQSLERISGTIEEIIGRITALKSAGSSAYLEIIYSGESIASELQQHIQEAAEGSDLKVLRIQNQRIVDRIIDPGDEALTLDDINPLDLFTKCMDAHQITQEERPALITAYRQVLRELEEHDVRAE
ncbi:MAG: exonuclease SbcCD subunit D C-terminal domain-containing protein [Spirochaetia bacterium]|nr:exonuclease SbcCD subunit D C-terminal domain-containing protein [Spirochaetia bacterium]